MIEKIIEFSLKQRLLVIVFAALITGLGIWSLQQLPIDAVPDVTNVQVQINTSAPALGPLEVEKLITFPIEGAMSGLPDIEEVRSLSRYGLSQVTVVFKDHVNIYFARQLVLERLQQAKEEIPKDLGTPTMGPIATGLGEIYLYTVEGEKYSPTQLRTLQDWLIKPQLRTTPGVTEVNSIGGYEKQYQVLPSPSKLQAYGVLLEDLLKALQQNNANAGGSYIVKNEEQILVRGVGLVQSVDDIENIVVGVKDGSPIYVRDLAEVREGPDTARTGAATHDGEETVIGTAIMLMGENSRTVSTRVHKKLDEIQTTLPEGVRIHTVYDRTYLVDRTIETVKKNLLEGGVLVIAVLLFLLGNARASLIVASAIPLSMLFAATGMFATKTSANLMSLGAIDFGLVVDGAVVMVENIIRRTSEKRKSGDDEILLAAREVARPVVFAVLIITIVYLPILTLQGIEGKMFRPMALTIIMALVGSLFFALNLVPVLGSIFVGGHIKEKENKIVRSIKERYSKTLLRVMNRPKKVMIAAMLLVLVSFLIFPFLGAEFIPRLDEEASAIEFIKPVSISVDEAVKLTKLLEKTLLTFPEVATVFTRTGTSEVATDPMGPDHGDVHIIFKRRVADKEKLIEKMKEKLSAIPGVVLAFSQPIELRVNELISGVRSDIAIKIFGDDLEVLKEKAGEVSSAVSKIRGSQDVKAEQVSGLPVLQVEVDRKKIARYGINVSDVLNLIETAVAGKSAGEVFEGVQRFELVVRYPEAYRSSAEAIGNLLVPSPTGQKIPLAQLVKKMKVEDAPSQISHERARRRIVIETNVRGRDIGSFVEEARSVVEKKVKLPPGYSIEWGGQFQNLESAKKRLLIVVPVSLFLIFLLLFFSFNSVKQALLVFTGIPLAVTGGILALFITRIHFSISAGVGFIALFGVAMLNGVVMVSYINQLRKEGMKLEEAVIEGAQTRLRPVLMTALVASLGFIPMAFAHGTGAEVQKPLATVVIGGLISSTILTLLVLPVLYARFERR